MEKTMFGFCFDSVACVFRLVGECFKIQNFQLNLSFSAAKQKNRMNA